MPQITTFFADCAALAAGDGPVTGAAVAEALLRACDALSDERFGHLERTAGATPAPTSRPTPSKPGPKKPAKAWTRGERVPHRLFPHSAEATQRQGRMGN